MKRLAIGLLLTFGCSFAPPAVSAQSPEIQQEVQETLLLLRRAPRASSKFVRALERTVDHPGYPDADTTLRDVLRDLRRRYGLVFEVDRAAFLREGIEAVLQRPLGPGGVPAMRQVAAGTVLERALDRVPTRSGTVYVVRAGHVAVTTRTGALAEWRGGWELLDERRGRLLGEATLASPPVLEALQLAADTADLIRQHRRLLPRPAEQ
jgi:hypothetical protein